MNQPRMGNIIQRVLALVAVLFGFVTIIAGGSVLTGTNPGYIVFKPLLIYNTAMGMAYMVTGLIAWRSLDKGKYAAGTIFVFNLFVLGAIAYVYATESTVAIDSIRAMVFRTVVWLALFFGLSWTSNRNT